MMTARNILSALLMALTLCACAATNQVGITRPDVPPAPSDRWTLRNNDGAGNPTLSTATIAWREAVVGSTAGINLVADCRTSELGPGLKLSIERDRLPRDALFGEAVNLNIVVRRRSTTTRRESIGTVPFEGFGVDQSGGYLFKPTDRLIRALQRGSTITVSSPAFGDVRFSLNGASNALRELGCV